MTLIRSKSKTAKAVVVNKIEPSVPKPANLALLSERNELKDVFQKLRTSTSDPIGEIERVIDVENDEVNEEPRKPVVIEQSSVAKDIDPIERKLAEFERKNKAAAKKVNQVVPSKEQVDGPHKAQSRFQPKKKFTRHPENVSDSESEDEGRTLPG